MQIQVRQRLELLDDNNTIEHDGAPVILPVREADAVMGETVTAFLARVKWHFDLPTICVINGECYGRAEWPTRALSLNDNIEFRSRPLGSGSGGSTAKSIGAVVAMVALTAFAPGIGSAAAGALLFGGGTATGTLASIISAAVIGAGALAVSFFLRPKTGGKDKTTDPLQSFGLQGNQAKPMQPIPVLNGRLKFSPEYAAPTYSEYFGDGMIDYCLFALTCGRMDIEKVFIGDSEIWDKVTGPNAAYPGIELEFVDPGNQVTLYPVNVVSAEELQGVELTTEWSQPFIPAPAGTSTKEVMIDLIWPSGAYHTGAKGNTIAANTAVELQARGVDDAGAPIGDWISPFSRVYTFTKQSQIRLTERLSWPGGRWQYRMRRVNPPTADGNGTDNVTWTALRAKIDGPQSFPRVMTMAVKGVASKQLSGVNGGQLKVLGTRILPVWENGQFVDRPTRSIAWAALDWWRNGDYSAGLNIADIDFATFLQLDALWAQLGHTFDYRFTEVQNLDEVLETVLKAGRAYPAPVGDKLTIVRDQPRGLSRMLFTENDIVAGSLEIDYALSDEQWADGMVGEYVDERTWRIAEVSSAPDGIKLLKPARVKLDGVVNRTQATGMVRFMAAESQYRRITAAWTARMEGKLLKKGDLVKLSADEPETWGQSCEVISVRNGGYTLTLDPAPVWNASGNHYIELRRRDGRPWGPVKVTKGGTADTVLVDTADAASVAATQGMSLGEAVSRKVTQEFPWAAFSPGEPRTFPVLITEGTPDQDGEHIALRGVLDAPEVYTTTETGVVPLPQIPNLYSDALPVIIGLVAQISQRQATLILSAGWVPAKNAVSYEASVSYDGGTTWAGAYRGGDTTFEALVGGSSTMRVRVRGITPAGQPGAWYVVEVVAPELSIDGDIFANLSIAIEKFSEETQAQIRSIADLGRGTLAYGDDQTRSALRTSDDTFRGAIRQLTEVVDRLANEAATTQLNNFEQRELIKVGSGGNFAAIERANLARISDNEAFAETTRVLTANLETADTKINGNATAIEQVKVRVSNHDGQFISTAEDINILGARIDANDLSLYGSATGTQGLITRVSLQGEKINSLAEDYIGLRADVNTNTTDLQGQATAYRELKAVVEKDGEDIQSTATRVEVLESKVSDPLSGNDATATALSQLKTDVTKNTEGIRATSESLKSLKSGIENPVTGLAATASAVSQTKTDVNEINGKVNAAATNIQTLQTKVGQNTATLTTYGTSVDGIKLEWGVAFEIDNATGGVVMTGMKALDGSGIKVQMKLAGDLFVDGGITSRMVSTTSLITTSAQIGTLTVDNFNVKDGGISTLVSAHSNGRVAAVTINVRTAGAVSVLGSRVGDLSSRFPQNTTNTGALNIYRNGVLIGAIPANFTMDPDFNLRASYMRLGPTTYPLLDYPGVGTHKYEVLDDNNVNIGGVYISVQESK